jgi:hypothetical protein
MAQRMIPMSSATTLRRLRAAVAVLATVAAGARAQGGGPTVRGRVVVDDTLAVAMANVELVSVGTRMTDSAGRFSFPNVEPGRYAVHVRRLGFAPYDDTLYVFATDTLLHKFELSQLAEHLQTVVIRGEMVEVPKGFEAIYRRGAHSFGYFMTAEQIAQRNPMETRDLLASIPGVLMVGNSVSFERCKRHSPGAGLSTQEGTPQVYVDGQRVTRFARQFGDEVEAALAQVEPRQIQAIEVYSGVSQIPGDFASQACAAIVIWTKRE